MPLRSTRPDADSGHSDSSGSGDNGGNSNSWKRRQFLASALATLTGSLLVRPQRALAGGPAVAWTPVAGGVFGAGDSASLSGGVLPVAQGATVADQGVSGDAVSTDALTIRQVIDRIQAEIPGAPFPQTVDTIKSGDWDQPVRGIVTTMFATDAVIEKTIRAGANFIIAHEPTFYNHLDQTDWLAGDAVYLFKRDQLERHGIVVWRFHDGWHEHNPDGILLGTLTALGWEKYYDKADPLLIQIPPITFRDLIGHVKQQLGVEKMKAIGDLSQTCRRIVLSPGASGGRSQIALLKKYEPDLFICGELNEWETSEYVRDARYQGQHTALLVTGHSVSEEAGMLWLVPWLQPKVPGVRITHIPSNDAFSCV